MSKASEWARALLASRNAAEEALENRPVSPPDIYLAGARLRFGVADDGRPTVLMIDANGTTVGGGIIDWAEDVEKLRVSARWVLDTFGESA